MDLDKVEKEWFHSYKPLFLREVPRSLVGVFTRATILVSIIICTYLTAQAVFTAPVRYDIEGLAGQFVPNPHRAYTPWQIWKMLPGHTDMKQSAYFLAFSWVLTLVICPLLVQLVALLLWFLPTNYRGFNLFYNMIIPIQSWAALDVFAVASVAASVELEQVSKWIIDQNYKQVCGPHGYVVTLLHADCFVVHSQRTWGTWTLIVAVVMFWVIWFYSLFQGQRAKKELTWKLQEAKAFGIQ